MIGAGWAINIVVAEWVIRVGRARRAVVRSPDDLAWHRMPVSLPGHIGRVS